MRKMSSLKEEARKPRLAEGVIAQLRLDITDGRLVAGAQLPTEPGLIERFGVSRTVIREALAELRAAGLVKAEQGRGVFVCDMPPGNEPYLSGEDQGSIPKTLEMLELRVGIETESAALAAVRRSSAQEFEIRACNDEMADLVAAKASASQADYDFHLAIARATNNSFYVNAMIRFGLNAIPRATFAVHPAASDLVGSARAPKVNKPSAGDVYAADPCERVQTGADTRLDVLRLVVEATARIVDRQRAGRRAGHRSDRRIDTLLRDCLTVLRYEERLEYLEEPSRRHVDGLAVRLCVPGTEGGFRLANADGAEHFHGTRVGGGHFWPPCFAACFAGKDPRTMMAPIAPNTSANRAASGPM